MAKKADDPYAVFDEHQIQAAIFRAYNKRRLPAVKMWAIPNGMKRDRITAKRLKDEGVQKGAPDIIAVVMGKVYFIEVKTLDGSLDDEQKDFHNELKWAGSGGVYTVYGYLDAIRLLETMGMIRRPKIRDEYETRGNGRVA